GKGLSTAAAGGKKLEQAAGQLASGMQGINTLLKQFISGHPDLAADENMVKLSAAAAKTSAGLDPLVKGLKSLNTGVAELSSKEGQLAAGAAQISGKLRELSK
ncbi:hypothetical protein K0U00_50865, partial [Paenibacillus sepulcri]|nr:hypothetical protein [Paenibacillus sepulcri]